MNKIKFNLIHRKILLSFSKLKLKIKNTFIE